MSSSGSENPSDLSHSLTCSGTQYSSSSPCTAHLPSGPSCRRSGYAPVPNSPRSLRCPHSRFRPYCQSRSCLHRSCRFRICIRVTAPLCVYSRFCYRSCRGRSCQCGLHSRRLAPRSLAPPRSPKVCASHRAACSRRSCSASQRTPPRTSAIHRQAHGAAPCAVLLHAPAARKRSASAAAGACCAVTLRTAPSPLRSLRSLRGLSAGSASPVPGLAPQGEEMSEKNARNSVGN